MDWVTGAFLIVGAIGVVLLAISLLFGELLQFGHADVDGPFSVPVVAGFVGSFGFVGGIVAALVPGAGAPSALLGGVAGLATAFPTGWLVIRLTRALMRMPTDATLTRDDLIGALGTVTTPIRPGGYGEVKLAISGQVLKYNARSERALPLGTPVLVIETPSETSVVVEETDLRLPPAIGV
jgi:membrane protein implicated in regulation of membrane protease activity